MADLQAANRMLLQSLPAIGEQHRCATPGAPACSPLCAALVASLSPCTFYGIISYTLTGAVRRAYVCK